MIEDIADVRRIQALTDQVFARRYLLSDFRLVHKQTVRDGYIPARVQEGVSLAERWPRTVDVHRQRQLPVRQIILLPAMVVLDWG